MLLSQITLIADTSGCFNKWYNKYDLGDKSPKRQGWTRYIVLLKIVYIQYVVVSLKNLPFCRSNHNKYSAICQ